LGTIGTIAIRSDLSELAIRRTRTLQIAGGIYVGAAVLALLLASLFQRAITRPIHRLLSAEKRVSREKDYTLFPEYTPSVKAARKPRATNPCGTFSSA